MITIPTQALERFSFKVFSKPFVISLLLLTAPLAPLTSNAQTNNALSKSLSEAQSMVKESKNSQERINNDIAETKTLLQEYKDIATELEETNVNLLHQQQVHTLQITRLKDLESQLSEISKTENSLIPMLLDVIDWLDKHVSNDLPFKINERSARIEQLKNNALDPSIPISQLYHSVLEAYQIENEYGYSIDSYKQSIKLENNKFEAQILRIGRVGLYYLSLDATHGGYWSNKEKRWLSIENHDIKHIAQGIKVAQKQIPPALLTLPLEIKGEK